MPVIAFLILTRLGRLDPVNAGATAAHYGLISAVTFITTTNFLAFLGIGYESYMVAMMALMEAPGIFGGILLARAFSSQQDRSMVNGNGALGSLVREALFGGSVLLLLGSFSIGLLTGKEGTELLKPFVFDLFPGALALFLLDMGLTAARRLEDFIRLSRFLLFWLCLPRALRTSQPRRPSDLLCPGRIHRFPSSGRNTGLLRFGPDDHRPLAMQGPLRTVRVPAYPSPKPGDANHSGDIT